MSFPRRFAATQRFTLGAPRTITISPSGQRVVFTRSLAGDDPVNRLWVLDLPDGETASDATEPREVADPIALLANTSGEMTAAEKARRERFREAGSGIVTYVANHDTSAAYYALQGQLYRTDLDAGTTTPLTDEQGAFDPRPNRADNHVAFVIGSELWITERESGSTHRVSPEADTGSGTVSWGSAEFVAAEEMGRHRGYWWSPDGDRLLAARVDNTDVDVWWISSPTEPWNEPRPHHYPSAGTTNATVDLAILNLDGGGRVDVDWRKGEFEYLANASWSPRAQPTLVVQTRDQRTLAVLTVDPQTGETTEIHRQTDEHWIELMPGVPAWSGERLITTTIENDTIKLSVDGQAVGPDGLQIRAVLRATATHATVSCTSEPTELHVARIALDGSGVEHLTSDPGVHRAVMGGSTMAITTADMDRFGTTTTVTTERGIAVDLASAAEEPTVMPNVTFVEAGSRGLRTAVLLPANHDGSPLPVLMDPYGGPHALRVQQARNLHLTSQWFADQGFAVVIVDGRGTPARGPAFERAVHGDLAAPVLDDQVDALHAAAEQFPLDLDRVAIRGWSFGGYLAALAVMRRPDIFHAGVAGAPVTDWRLYDTHYTERYLGHPDTDPTHYAQTDLSTDAASLTRPLLLIHGLADDNVVAAHTFALSRALLESGRAHQVLPLSGVTHMTPQEDVAENLLLVQLSFIRDALGITP